MLASIYEGGRVSEMKLFTVENSQPVLGETVYSYSVNDDGEETVTTFGRAYTKHNSTKEYVSSTDSVKTKGSISWNGWTVLNTESESDFFGRTTGKHYTVNLGEDDYQNFGTEYTYSDTETTATNKISRVKNTLNGAVKSDYGYTYDNRGNILTVSKLGVLFQQYVYDEASQVKAEYNYAEHTAMTYVYDANGNIVSKTPYTNVTSSDLSTATQGAAIVYGYGDSNWSDKLTSYDGQTISYDASGNPTSYRGETVTWNGRLMTSYTKDDRRYEYSYNSDGMRTVKRVYDGNELVYTYTYIWDGDVLLGGRMEVTDTDEPITIRYLYDDSGVTLIVIASSGPDLGIHSVSIPDMYLSGTYTDGRIYAGVHDVIIRTSKDVLKIQFIDPDGNTRTFSKYSTPPTEDDDELVWTIPLKFNLGKMNLGIRTRAVHTTFALTGEYVTGRVLY